MNSFTSEQEINHILNSDYFDPYQILGYHTISRADKAASIIRAFLPDAAAVWVIDIRDRMEFAMEQVHPDGFFEAVVDRTELYKYELKIQYHDGHFHSVQDPYAFLPVLSSDDLYLFNEGNQHRAWEKLGAHVLTVEGVKGVHFTVWAPNAKRVSVIGDFNHWDGRRHMMRSLGSSGVWEIFIPGLEEGEIYKYEIKTQENYLLEKADPYAYHFEMRPKSGSIVYNINKYKWNDQEWLERRAHTNPQEQPMWIYEVHLGSWMRVPEEDNRFLNYRELAEHLAEYVLEMGYTHIELLPVAEHPLDASWGYQVLGYYAPTSRHGTPDDFMFFVDYLHQRGIGVLMDWVPAHFPKDGHGLREFDGTHLYEYADPRLGEHKDWGTLIFNYGRNEVRNFLLSNALFWLDKYHLDGFRVDAVASMLYLDYSRKEGEWLPNEYGGRENLQAIDFLKRFNELCYKYFPGIVTIAEESTAWPAVSRPTYLGGLGFGMKWNMGWMNDILSYFSKDPIYRKYHQGMITFALLYAFHENFVLVLSHDEVVHGKRALLDKMPGDFWQKFANLRLLFGFMLGHPGKKLLFQSGEFGQWKEWQATESIEWHLLEFEPHQKLQRFVRDLNHLYKSEPSLYEVDFDYRGFEWIDFNDSDNSIISFIRRAKNPDDFLIFICNLTPTPRWDYRIGVPAKAYYQEIINSDAEIYYGSNLGNLGGHYAEELPWQSQPFSIRITVPPLATVIFKPQSNY